MPKDACYHKVKARYRVFPSAYASGAIAKCRKVGAANYGNGGKKAKKKAMGGVVKMQKGGEPKIRALEDILNESIMKDLKDLKKVQFKKGARFSVDSKGNVTKNFKDGGSVPKQKRKRKTKNQNIARGCGIVMANRRKTTTYT